MNPTLELNGVHKTYRTSKGEVHAMDSIGFAVAPGEFVAVQGPSGCGKSTLLLAAGGLLAPEAGTVTITGQNVYALRAEARARFRAAHLGFVFQQFHLVPYLSVLDNVLTPSLALPGHDARPRATELIEQFGLTPRVHHVPGELSTGERQRVALARALLNRPQLLLADEPTGNLDRANAEIVLASLAEFARNGGAVLLVTHDTHAATYASRSLRIENGRLV